MQEIKPDPDVLKRLLAARMPFGKYKGTRLIDLPEPYVCWFQRTGFPGGTLGEQLQLLYEIKLNGLESLLSNQSLSVRTAVTLFK